MNKEEKVTLIDAFKDFKEEKNIDRPVMMGVLRRRDGYEIGFKMINGAVSEVFTYHYKGEQKYESEEDAQSALNAMATARHWKPYQKLRRW